MVEPLPAPFPLCLGFSGMIGSDLGSFVKGRWNSEGDKGIWDWDLCIQHSWVLERNLEHLHIHDTPMSLLWGFGVLVELVCDGAALLGADVL